MQALRLGFHGKKPMTRQYVSTSPNFCDCFSSLVKGDTHGHMPSCARGCVPRCREQEEVQLLRDSHRSGSDRPPGHGKGCPRDITLSVVPGCIHKSHFPKWTWPTNFGNQIILAIFRNFFKGAVNASHLQSYQNPKCLPFPFR